MALKEITIYRDERGDRNCPSCKAEEKHLHLNRPTLHHNRTTLYLSGHCEKCGCDFTFQYVLYTSDIIIHSG